MLVRFLRQRVRLCPREVVCTCDALTQLIAASVLADWAAICQSGASFSLLLSRWARYRLVFLSEKLREGDKFERLYLLALLSSDASAGCRLNAADLVTWLVGLTVRRPVVVPVREGHLCRERLRRPRGQLGAARAHIHLQGLPLLSVLRAEMTGDRVGSVALLLQVYKAITDSVIVRRRRLVQRILAHTAIYRLQVG